jgi:hypothetical protein
MTPQKAQGATTLILPIEVFYPDTARHVQSILAVFDSARAEREHAGLAADSKIVKSNRKALETLAKSTVHRFDYRHRKMTRLTFFPNETEQSGLPIGKRTLSVFQIAQRKGW